MKNPLDALEKGRRTLDMKARRGSASPVRVIHSGLVTTSRHLRTKTLTAQLRRRLVKPAPLLAFYPMRLRRSFAPGDLRQPSVAISRQKNLFSFDDDTIVYSLLILKTCSRAACHPTSIRAATHKMPLFSPSHRSVYMYKIGTLTETSIPISIRCSG